MKGCTPDKMKRRPVNPAENKKKMPVKPKKTMYRPQAR